MLLRVLFCLYISMPCPLSQDMEIAYVADFYLAYAVGMDLRSLYASSYYPNEVGNEMMEIRKENSV